MLITENSDFAKIENQIEKTLRSHTGDSHCIYCGEPNTIPEQPQTAREKELNPKNLDRYDFKHRG